MMSRTNARELGIARQYLEGLNLSLIHSAGARAQGVSAHAEGARAPASIAAPPVALEVLRAAPVFVCDADSPRRDRASTARARKLVPAQGALITPLGVKTALRRVPRALARLPRHDARFITAAIYVDACERLGSVAGQDLAGASGGGGASDGGAVSGVQVVRVIARAHAAINGWEWDARAHCAARPQRPLLVLAPRNCRAGRKAITARALLDGVLIHSKTAKEILIDHGWSPQSPLVVRLNGLFVALLGQMVGPIAEEQRGR
jgi:hypothetical protein